MVVGLMAELAEPITLLSALTGRGTLPRRLQRAAMTWPMAVRIGRAQPRCTDCACIDLSTVLAGPNCARYLADFGADVIKVERPDGGDSLRNLAWRDPRDGEGLWWKLVNRNKRTIALDLKLRDRSRRACCGWSSMPTC